MNKSGMNSCQALCSSAMHYKWYYWMSMSNIQNDKITDTHKHAV